MKRANGIKDTGGGKKEKLSKSEGSGGKCNSSHRNPSFHLRRVA